MDKIDNGVNFYINQVTQQNKLSMLVNDYNMAEDEIIKRENYAKIKALLIEMHGVVALSNI